MYFYRMFIHTRPPCTVKLQSASIRFDLTEPPAISCPSPPHEYRLSILCHQVVDDTNGTCPWIESQLQAALSTNSNASIVVTGGSKMALFDMVRFELTVAIIVIGCLSVAFKYYSNWLAYATLTKWAIDSVVIALKIDENPPRKRD